MWNHSLKSPKDEVPTRQGVTSARRSGGSGGCVGERGFPEVGSEKGYHFQSLRSCAHLLVKSESVNAFDKQAGWPPHSGTSWDIWFIERLTDPGRRRGEGAGPIIRTWFRSRGVLEEQESLAWKLRPARSRVLKLALHVGSEARHSPKS